MQKNIIFVVLVTMLICGCGETKNFTQSETNSSIEAISPEQMTKRMGIGVDASWSEFPSQIKDYSTKATIAFAKKGFKHIRLRVAENNASKMWIYLDKEIQDALDNNMIPIIANQSATFENNPTQKNQTEWVQWWHTVATHYKNAPYELMFDLEVEIGSRSPLSHEPIDQLNEAYKQAIHAIRHAGGHNDKRIVIISAHRRSDPKKLNMLNVASYEGNGYLIGEFHEGYASGPSKDPSSSHYYEDGSTQREIDLIQDRVKAAVAWRKKTNIPVWEGAWMPGNYNKGNDYTIQEQEKFSSDFLKILNKYHVPSAINATNKFYDLKTNKWNEREAVIDSILTQI